MRMFLIFVFCCGALMFAAPSPAVAQVESSPMKKQKPIPPSLPQIGELGENVYDMAKANDWTQAAEKLAALKDAVKKLGSELPAARADEDHFKETVIAIEKAVTAKDRQATMRGANEVTLLVANLTEPFGPKIPADVTRLDYYGRELEVWSAAEDINKLKATVTKMQKTWDRLRPTVMAHNGMAEAKQFDKLMTQAQTAKSSHEYDRAAAALLEAVDTLETVFEQDSSTGNK